MNKFARAMNLIRRIRYETDTAVLFYSAGGKDGIALLDMLARVFPNIICYYMYLIPNLDHIAPYIKWAKTHYPSINVEVRQIKHYQRDYYDKYGFFQLGNGNDSIRPRKIGDVEEAVRQETGIKYAFSGMKGIDGYMKLMRLKTFLKRNGDYLTEKGMVYPLAAWTNKEVLQYIDNRNLIRPFVYNPKDRSQGFSVDLRSLLVLRKRFPRDYARTIAEFPFAEKLIFDFDRYGLLPHGQEKNVIDIINKLDDEE